MTCSLRLAYQFFHNNTKRMNIMSLKVANSPKNVKIVISDTYCHVNHGCSVAAGQILPKIEAEDLSFNLI